MKNPTALVTLLLMVCSSVAVGQPSAPTAAHDLYQEANEGDLLLINGNTWLVPLYSAKHKPRLESFAEFVHSLPVLPHVMTLQEVWQQKRVELVKRLFPEFQGFTSGEHRRFIGVKLSESGLVTLVRRDLVVTEVRYDPLERRFLTGNNRLVGKGSLTVTVEFEGHRFMITNVHLPNTSKGRFLQNTKDSLQELDPKGIVVGDLNLEPHQLPGHFVVHDSTPTFGNDAFGFKRARRIDYVIPDETTIVESTVVTGPDGKCLPISDHCFLAARLKPKNPGRETLLAQSLLERP
jgi:endonuclease/exonuclease/phosphatase family metal-dependent hydrolase